MNDITFKVEGKVKGKGRPKFANRGKFVKAYTPIDTVNYEQWIRLAYQQACSGQDTGGWEKSYNSLKMILDIHIARPKAHYNSKGEVFPRHEFKYPTTKPDIDNIIKVIADSLNTIAYHDDSQIVVITAHKYYKEEDSVTVTLMEIEEGSWK